MYDPQQKTLLADKGETGVGIMYQAQVPHMLKDSKLSFTLLTIQYKVIYMYSLACFDSTK